MSSTSFNLMAVAEGASGKPNRGLSDLCGNSINKSLLSAFEQPHEDPDSPKSKPISPKRTSGWKPPIVTEQAPEPPARSTSAKSTDKAPVVVDVKSSDAVDDPPPRTSIADNPFKRTDLLKVAVDEPRSPPKDVPSPNRLSSSLSAKFEREQAEGNAREQSKATPVSPSERASRNSLGDSPFLRSDSAKKSALTPPWEKTATPVTGGTPTKKSPRSSKEELRQATREQSSTTLLAAEVTRAAVAAATREQSSTTLLAAEVTRAAVAAATREQSSTTLLAADVTRATVATATKLASAEPADATDKKPAAAAIQAAANERASTTTALAANAAAEKKTELAEVKVVINDAVKAAKVPADAMPIDAAGASTDKKPAANTTQVTANEPPSTTTELATNASADKAQEKTELAKAKVTVNDDATAADVGKGGCNCAIM